MTNEIRKKFCDISTALCYAGQQASKMNIHERDKECFYHVLASACADLIALEDMLAPK